MKRLKIVLQSNVFLGLLLIFTTLYVVVLTVVIKYDSKYSNNTVIEGVITDVERKENSLNFILKNTEKIQCSYYFSALDNIPFDLNNLLGKKVQVKGVKKDISQNTIPNTFNYQKYLYHNKIYLAFKVNKITILEDENIFYHLKNTIVNKINNYDEHIKTYLSLFILGDKTYLDDNLYDAYRTNGIWHLFAVSGMHIGLIILVLNTLLKKFKFKKIIISLILFYFMFLTNFSASVMRATLFYFLKNFLAYLNLSLDNKKILIYVAIIILLINPFMIYNAGFQYSFLITFSIMLLSPYIKGSYFKQIFLISLLSFIVSLPITVNMNYEINLLSIFLNIFYVPFISLIIFPLSILTFIIPFLSFVLKIGLHILELTTNIFYHLKLNIVVPKMSYLIIIFYYFTLIILYHYKKKRYLLLVLTCLGINYLLPKLDNNYYVNFLDVSQGDSCVIISPHQKEVMMIDTGGLVNSDYHVADNSIVYLKSLGIRKIDYLILSHGDYDHAGEGINILNKMKIKKVIFNCGDFNLLEQNLIKTLDEKNIPYASCLKELTFFKNKLTFLNDKVYSDENDSSNVLNFKINNYQFLFMGDASFNVEHNLLDEYNLKNIDILKVGHHGSKTSSSKDFITTIKPSYAIISVGKNNFYGHPNKEVLENLENSQIYRTDLNGSILFIINKKRLKIKTYAPLSL